MGRDGLIDVPGGRVWFHDEGDGPGTPLLCLHGGPGASSDYLKAFDSLATKRRVIRYDQLGGGRSEYEPSDDLWRVERFVDELSVVRNALGLEQIHLYGHSWGTLLAVEHLLAGAVGVVSLTLASPWLSVDRYLADVRRLAGRLPGVEQATIEALSEGRAVAAELVESAVYAFYRSYFLRDDEKLATLFAGGKPGPVYEAMWGPNEFLCTSPVLAEVDLTGRLSELDLPVLLLCGEYDACTPETTLSFQSMFPGAEAIVLAGCSHMSILENTATHVGAVDAFIARTEASVIGA